MSMASGFGLGLLISLPLIVVAMLSGYRRNRDDRINSPTPSDQTGSHPRPSPKPTILTVRQTIEEMETQAVRLREFGKMIGGVTPRTGFDGCQVSIDCQLAAGIIEQFVAEKRHEPQPLNQQEQ